MIIEVFTYILDWFLKNGLFYLKNIFGIGLFYLFFNFYTELNYSPPWSSVRGISQARILEWVAVSFSGDLPNPGIEPAFPAKQEDSLPLSHQETPIY